MAPKLHMTEGSPVVRAVLMCEKALGIELEHIEVDFANAANLKPEYLKLNPQHTVPTLIDDDGTVIGDSHAIMVYLVEKYRKGDSLYPKNLAKRALVDQRLFFDSGNVFPILRHIGVSLIKKRTDKVSEEDKELLKTSYELLNTFLQDNMWVAGDDITIADFSLITSMHSADNFFPIDPKFENIHAWLKRAHELPYWEVNTKGLLLAKAYYDSLLKK